MNRLSFTEIYLYRFFTRVANDVETNPGTGIVNPTKTIAKPYIQGVMLKYLVQQMQAHSVWQYLGRHFFYNFINPISSYSLFGSHYEHEHWE